MNKLVRISGETIGSLNDGVIIVKYLMKGDSIGNASLDVVFYPVGVDETGEPV